MSGLMRRLTRGRAATDDEGTPQASAASEPVDATHDAQQGGSAVPANGTLPAAGEEPTTAVLPATAGESAGGDASGAARVDAATAVSPEADRDLPAGVDP